jgi:sugar lactone lactonase YvrE
MNKSSSDCVFISNLFSYILGQPPLSSHIKSNAKWKQNGITIAGGHGPGDQLNQLSRPSGIYVDDDNQCIYIADWRNHRIVEWKFGAKIGHVVAGGNGKGSEIDQLDNPSHVIVDKKNDSLIICDNRNKRVVWWSRQNRTNVQTIISNIYCNGLAMDRNGDLYVSDCRKNEVRRWKIGNRNGRIVAGGNGKGN